MVTTELEAFHQVRAKFPAAVPEVQAFGSVFCMEGGKQVAQLTLRDGSWSVIWGADTEAEPEAEPDEH